MRAATEDAEPPSRFVDAAGADGRDDIAGLLAAARADPDGPSSLAALAERAHFSRFHLSRMLRNHLGFSFREFVAALKVQRGIDVLVEGHEVIRSQTESGHESASSYHHSFLQHTGLAPKRYRDQLRFLASFLLRHMADRTPRTATYRCFAAEEHEQPHALTIEVTGAAPGSALFVALNPTVILKGRPTLGIALMHLAECVVASIPDGDYFAMVVEAPASAGVQGLFQLDQNRRQLRREPITFPLAAPTRVTLALRDLDPADPPITPNLPHLFFVAVTGRVDVQERNSRQVPRQ